MPAVYRGGMTVDTALALVSAAAGGAATEAGRHAWESLAALARRVTGGAEPGNGDAGPADPGDEEAVRVLTARLAEHARADAGFAAELCDWAAAHHAVLTQFQTQFQDEVHGRGDVHNAVSEGATVSGTVVQARDISGGITFG